MILHEKPDCKQNVFKAHEKHCAKAIAGHTKGRKSQTTSRTSSRPMRSTVLRP